MTGTSRWRIQALMTVLALAVLGVCVWWAIQIPETSVAEGQRLPPAPTGSPAPSPDPTVPADEDGAASAAPTQTPVLEGDTTPDGAEPTSPPDAATPTATVVPEPVAFVDLVATAEAVAQYELDAVLSSPLGSCQLTGGPSLGGSVALRCIEPSDRVEVTAAAPGRVVHVVSEAPVLTAVSDDIAPEWSWASQAALGPHVVIDHGPTSSSTRNVQTVSAGLDSIADGIRVGTWLDAGAAIGTVEGPRPEMLFQLWVDDTRQDGVRVLAEPPPLEVQQVIAAALGRRIEPATDERCPLNLSFGSLPGATRAYRNGTHRGIDFNCGTADRFATAIAPGTVVYLVDDYQDPTVADREQLLASAGLAGFTPHWTLTMLYGNVVVIDHGEVFGVGRLVTIAAHLEQVDPAITLGSTVEPGQVLGEIGNRGTNASSQGVRGSDDPSLHLHWELYVDGWYLGAGVDAANVGALVTAALCGASPTAGCPTT